MGHGSSTPTRLPAIFKHPVARCSAKWPSASAKTFCAAMVRLIERPSLRSFSVILTKRGRHFETSMASLTRRSRTRSLLRSSRTPTPTRSSSSTSPYSGENPRDDLVATVVVDVPIDEAVRRLVGSRGMDETDARHRIASQISREDRLARATHVIDNSGDLDFLRSQVEELWHALCELSADSARR